MSNRKSLVLLLLLLLFGSVFLCGCEYEGPIYIQCAYNAATDRWDCFYWIVFQYTDPYTGDISTILKPVRYTTQYCDPYSDPNKAFVIACYGKKFAPPSLSPSPSPTQRDSGTYYKITESNGGNNGGGGGGPGPTS